MNRNEFNDVVRTEGLNKFNIGDFSTIAKAANALGCINDNGWVDGNCLSGDEYPN